MIFDIENIIEQRLALQSTEKALSANFGIKDNRIVLDRRTLYHVLNRMDATKKKKFLSLIGGPANYKRTEKYINKFVYS